MARVFVLNYMSESVSARDVANHINKDCENSEPDEATAKKEAIVTKPCLGLGCLKFVGGGKDHCAKHEAAAVASAQKPLAPSPQVPNSPPIA